MGILFIRCWSWLLVMSRNCKPIVMEVIKNRIHWNNWHGSICRFCIGCKKWSLRSVGTGTRNSSDDYIFCRKHWYYKKSRWGGYNTWLKQSLHLSWNLQWSILDYYQYFCREKSRSNSIQGSIISSSKAMKWHAALETVLETSSISHSRSQRAKIHGMILWMHHLGGRSTMTRFTLKNNSPLKHDANKVLSYE